MCRCSFQQEEDVDQKRKMKQHKKNNKQSYSKPVLKRLTWVSSSVRSHA